MKQTHYVCRECQEIFLSVDAQYEEQNPRTSSEWIGQKKAEHENTSCTASQDEFLYTDGTDVSHLFKKDKK